MTSAIAATGAPRPACAIIRPLVSSPEPDQRRTDADRRLARRLTRREPGALEETYRRYGGPCFGLLTSTLRDRAAAEDVQQQVFLEVWQRAPGYDPDRGGLLTWILTIARSRAIDHLRRRVPEPAGDLATIEHGNPSADEIDELVERWRLAGLLERLHPDESRVLRMRFYDELTQAEIAERTGIALGTVKMRMVSGLRRLRELLEER
jgi:RNA polymerase sigma-70 factor (ECF subfamily)